VKIALCAAAVSLLLGASTASASTITFDSLEHVDDTVAAYGPVGTPYAESGYLVTPEVGVECDPTCFPIGNLLSFGTLATAYTGSTAILSSWSPTITKLDGSSFDFISVDVFRIFNPSITVQPLLVNLGIRGTHSDGSVTDLETFQITEYRPATGFPFQTFNQPGNFGVDFTDLTSLQIYTINGETFQFDNLVLSDHTAVPEPSTLVLLGLGLAGFGIVKGRLVA
jgi:hypothetical protein